MKKVIESITSSPLSCALLAMDENLSVLAAGAKFFPLLSIAENDHISLRQLVSDSDFEAASDMLHRCLASGSTGGRVTAACGFNGKCVEILPQHFFSTDDGAAALCLFIDGEPTKALSYELSLANRRFDCIVEMTHQLIFDVNLTERTIEHCSFWFSPLKEDARADRFAAVLADNGFIRPEDAESLQAYLDTALSGKAPLSLNTSFRFSSDFFTAVRINGRMISDAYRSARHFICSIVPRTKGGVPADSIISAFDFDPLTGLYGKTATERLIRRYLNTHSDASGTLIFFRFERFKELNESRGHIFGDMILREISELIRKFLRENDLLGRYSGAILAVFCSNFRSESMANEFAQRIKQKIDNTYNERNSGFSLDCHIGVAVFGGSGDSVEELYRRADLSLYHDKGDLRRHSHYRLI